MDAPGYLPELDLVAVAPDGELAAFCMCQIFMGDSEKEGWTDPVGTHPAHRRRGLAAALISAGMGLLRERGVETALLGTSSVNIAMQRLAEELGFRKVANTLWFSKSI
jgi:ribosomal protein S18 acetylase RimI-like enzyme